MTANFSVRILRANPHREQTTTWKAGQLVVAMEGCDIRSIVRALTALEKDTTKAGVGDPARWLTHFAGLESVGSGKNMDPWIEIIHDGEVIKSKESYRVLLGKQN
jgi:hypothetical protein